MYYCEKREIFFDTGRELQNQVSFIYLTLAEWLMAGLVLYTRDEKNINS